MKRYVISGYHCYGSEIVQWLNQIMEFYGVEEVEKFWIVKEPNIRIEGKVAFSVIARVRYKVS